MWVHPRTCDSNNFFSLKDQPLQFTTTLQCACGQSVLLAASQEQVLQDACRKDGGTNFSTMSCRFKLDYTGKKMEIGGRTMHFVLGGPFHFSAGCIK